MIYWYDYVWFFGLLSLPALALIAIERLSR